mgnify:FL=1
MKRRILRAIIAGSLIASTLTLSACQSNRTSDISTLSDSHSNQASDTADLMAGVKAASRDTVKTDDIFKGSYDNFTAELLKKCFDGKSNTLISPLSVSSALTMTANGTNGQTKDEMEKVLGNGISLDELNKYLSSFGGSMTSGEGFKLKNANSIWFRDEENRLTVEKDFLQTNADYFGAAIYKRAFDNDTCKEINNWVNDNTDGMIDNILDSIPDEAIMYLVNAVSFDAEWDIIYRQNDIADGKFTNSEDKLMNVTMMCSDESIYLEDEDCKGFMKQYKDGKYSFAAILPNGDIKSFITSLSGEKLCKILGSAEDCIVEVKLPKFGYEYSSKLNDALSALGMPTAFDSDNADFSGIGKSTMGNISIGKVIHKTKIEVNEKGTKAGAAALVEMVDEGCVIAEKQVILNRPFMYMILDNETMLPLFAGVYTGV